MVQFAPEFEMFLGKVEIKAEGTVTNPPGVDVDAAIAAAEAAQPEGNEE